MHSLVINILFKKGSAWSKFKNMCEMAWEHARNLGLYVLCYKTLLYVFQRLEGGYRRGLHELIAGFLAGFCCFKEKTNVNYQIILYLFSRILIGLVSYTASKYNFGQTWNTHPALAAICWGTVMLLYEDDKSTLQPSLKSSMDFLYTQSETYHSWADFVPFYIPKSVVKWVSDKFSKKKDDKATGTEKMIKEDPNSS